MLESIFGNATMEKILFFIFTYRNGYARQMANSFDIPVNGIQQQLLRLENGGVLVSQMIGKTRLYQFNPIFPFIDELKRLLEKAISTLPQKELEKYYRNRTRPRRKGKPL